MMMLSPKTQSCNISPYLLKTSYFVMVILGIRTMAVKSARINDAEPRVLWRWLVPG